MNIISEYFVNNIRLGICIFPSDALSHIELGKKMREFTTFYGLRFAELVSKNDTPIIVCHSDSIESGLAELAQKCDHVFFMASGARVYDNSLFFEIKELIQKHPHYLAAAHILEWKENWYELHHQFVLVNTKNWIKAGKPQFGGWTPCEEELPEIVRSVENFHDDYTPIWIKFTGNFSRRKHSKQGWNFINQAARHKMEIINWDQKIRNKRTYYYPESGSEAFLRALTTLVISEDANLNQKDLINQLVHTSNQIWLLNSEYMDLDFLGDKFETLALPAAGFKFLDVFRTNSLLNGKIIFYDYNYKSLEWIQHLYESNSLDILSLIINFKDREHFKLLGNEVFDKNGFFTKGFIESYRKTINYFGGTSFFKQHIQHFRKTPVEFIRIDLLKEPELLIRKLQGRSAINISNIFCTDFTNVTMGMNGANESYKNFLSLLPKDSLLLGHDPFCHYSRKVI